jgi:hypothetical protein
LEQENASSVGMHRNAIDGEVLTGTARNKRILIPRINLTYVFLFYHLIFKELNFEPNFSTYIDMQKNSVYNTL